MGLGESDMHRLDEIIGRRRKVQKRDGDRQPPYPRASAQHASRGREHRNAHRVESDGPRGPLLIVHVQALRSMPLPPRRQSADRAMELATLKDLRQAAQQTQEELAATLGGRQDTISRLEKRTDMLLSTLRQYVEGMGGKLELIAKFPNRPPVVINHMGEQVALNKR